MKLVIFFLLLSFYSMGQTTIVNEQFASTPPTGWLSTTPSGWATNNYGASNARSGSYALRLSSASSGNGKYLYIPINVQNGYTYTITFWTKRICSTTINTNETANQTTLLSTFTQTNSNCNSNWSTWYQWSNTYVPTYTGTMYFQILANTVYGGPTSIYIEDVTIVESPPVDLPIELLYFKGRKSLEGNLLQWETASENNNDYFTIYRSTYPIEWLPIVEIDGAGNSITNNKYQFIDSRIEDDINYYVLRQTDYDGNYKECEIISIDNRKPYITPVRIVNTIGQDVSIDYNGLKFVTYEDGSVERVY